MDLKDFSQLHHYILKRVFGDLLSTYPLFPYRSCDKPGPNLIPLTPADHMGAHELLYRLYKKPQDALAVRSFNRELLSEVSVEALREMGRRGTQIAKELKRGWFSSQTQKKISAIAWQDKEKMLAQVRLNGMKGDKEGKRRSGRSGRHEDRVKAGTIGGAASQRGVTFVKTDVFFFKYYPYPPASGWSTGQRKRRVMADKNNDTFIGLFITGYDLPKDVARVLYKYTPADQWLSRVAGKRVGELIRGKISYLGWSVTKVNSESEKASLIEAFKNEVGDAPIQIVEEGG